MRSKKVVIIIIAVIVVALGGAVAWLFASGRLLWVTPGAEQVSVSKVTCGADIVAEYNEERQYLRRDGSDTPTIDVEGLKETANKVRKMENYASDPTCQTILFWVSYTNKDSKGASDAYLAIKDLHGKGLFANTNTLGVSPLEDYERIVGSLTPSGEDKGRNAN